MYRRVARKRYLVTIQKTSGMNCTLGASVAIGCIFPVWKRVPLPWLREKSIPWPCVRGNLWPNIFPFNRWPQPLMRLVVFRILRCCFLKSRPRIPAVFRMPLFMPIPAIGNLSVLTLPSIWTSHPWRRISPSRMTRSPYLLCRRGFTDPCI